MFFIPGFLISIVTFPGVIVHELAHQLFCKLFRIPVYEVCYFRVGNPAGYVIHAIPKRLRHSFFISVGPFFLNTIVGAIIAAPSAIQFFKFETALSPLDYFFVWLGVSIAMHSFPSTGDAKALWESIKQDGTPLKFKVFGIPIIAIIYIFSFGSVIWLDLGYGIAVATLIPNLISLFAV